MTRADMDETNEMNEPDETGKLGEARVIGAALRQASLRLRASGVSATPNLDAQLLLSDLSHIERPTLLAFPERALTAEQALAFAERIARRERGEPVAYLIGRRAFMGLELRTDARALIPRPETELLVEEALTNIRTRLDAQPAVSAFPIVADIGTGSGAIAIAIATHELRLPHIYASDISADALALASENAQHLGVAGRISFVRGDLFEPLHEPCDVAIANLPYIDPTNTSMLAPDVREYEPALALFGEGDGLGHFRRFFAQAPAYLRPGATVLLEHGYDQRTALAALARAAFPQAILRAGRDYAGLDRYLVIETIR